MSFSLSISQYLKNWYAISQDFLPYILCKCTCVCWPCSNKSKMEIHIFWSNLLIKMRAFIFLDIFSRLSFFCAQSNILFERSDTNVAIRVQKNNKIFILYNASGVFRCMHLFWFLLLYMLQLKRENNNNHKGDATALNKHSIYTQIALTSAVVVAVVSLTELRRWTRKERRRIKCGVHNWVCCHFCCFL